MKSSTFPIIEATIFSPFLSIPLIRDRDRQEVYQGRQANARFRNRHLFSERA